MYKSKAGSKKQKQTNTYWVGANCMLPFYIHQPADPMRTDKVCMLAAGECVRSTTTTRKGRARESELLSPLPTPSALLSPPSVPKTIPTQPPSHRGDLSPPTELLQRV